jgi:diacylglycerol kinase (ATP)
VSSEEREESAGRRKQSGQRSALRRLARAFADAFRGWAALLRRERNARIHFLVTLLVIAAGVWLSVSATDWCLLVIALALVWIAEAFNTAIELLADEVSLEHRERLGRAKDIAAGGVLFATLAVITIGVFVFGPRLF